MIECIPSPAGQAIRMAKWVLVDMKNNSKDGPSIEKIKEKTIQSLLLFSFLLLFFESFLILSMKFLKKFGTV